MADVSKRIEALSPRQQEFLLQRLRQRAIRAAQTANEIGPPRLVAFARQRQWVVNQQDPSLQACHGLALLSVTGRLETAALERALHELLMRHLALRTLILRQDDRIVEITQAMPEIRLTINHRDADPVEPYQPLLAEWARQQAHQLFPGQGPLFRVSVAHLADHRYAIACTLHHSLYSPRALEHLVDELLGIYLGASQSCPMPSVSPKANESDLDQRRAFWEHELRNLPSLEWGTADQPTGASVHAQSQTLTLTPAITARLRTLAAESQQPCVLVWLTLCQILVGGASGAPDLLLGFDDSGDGPAQIEVVPDLLPVRVMLNECLSFRDQLALTAERYQLLCRHRLTAEQIIDHLVPDRPLNRPALMQVSVGMRNQPSSSWKGPEASFQLLDLGAGPARYDLCMELLEGGAGFEVRWTYNPTLVTAGAIAAMIELLSTLVHDPDRVLADIDGFHLADYVPVPTHVTPLTSHTQVAPSTMLEELLLSLCSLALHRPGLRPDDDLIDSGMNQLTALRVLVQIGQLLDLWLPLSALRPGDTVTGLAKQLYQQLPQPWFVMEKVRHGSPLVAIQPEGTRPPLFCMHPVGGDVGCYATLIRCLGLDQPIYGLQAPGIDGLMPPHATIEAMAADYIAAIREVQPHGPYYLAGWSLGGLIAFAMAAQLEQDHQPVALVAMFDTIADWCYLPVAARAPRTRTDLLKEYFAGEIAIIDHTGQEAGAQIMAVIKRLRQSGPRPRGVAIGHWLSMFDVYERNNLAISCYEPVQYQGPVVAFYALDSYLNDPTEPVKWSAMTDVEPIVELLPGDHMSIFTEPYVQLLGERLQYYLEQAQQAQTDRKREP